MQKHQICRYSKLRNIVREDMKRGTLYLLGSRINAGDGVEAGGWRSCHVDADWVKTGDSGRNRSSRHNMGWIWAGTGWM
jgi:hypothetical protein